MTESDAPSIRVSPFFHGSIAPADLLTTEATLCFVAPASVIEKGGVLFEVRAKNFAFCLMFKESSIVIQRNEAVYALKINKYLTPGNNISIFAAWSFSWLCLDCSSHGHNGTGWNRPKIPTLPVAPPVDLLRWARKQNLIDTPSYITEEALREKVYSCLKSVNEKIREADAYKSFWNISYSGNTITSRMPKKEVDIQPVVHCLLSDQMLLSNIEVIPEHKTGEGNIDFTFNGFVEGKGLRKICAEFKLAHSDDLVRGLLKQLPSYMAVTQSTYGAYCVLSFKGNWLDRPVLENDQDLEFFLGMKRLSSKNPAHANIRTFVFHPDKPATASKK